MSDSVEGDGGGEFHVRAWRRVGLGRSTTLHRRRTRACAGIVRPSTPRGAIVLRSALAAASRPVRRPIFLLGQYPAANADSAPGYSRSGWPISWPMLAQGTAKPPNVAARLHWGGVRERLHWRIGLRSQGLGVVLKRA